MNRAGDDGHVREATSRTQPTPARVRHGACRPAGLLRSGQQILRPRRLNGPLSQCRSAAALQHLFSQKPVRRFPGPQVVVVVASKCALFTLSARPYRFQILRRAGNSTVGVFRVQFPVHETTSIGRGAVNAASLHVVRPQPLVRSFLTGVRSLAGSRDHVHWHRARDPPPCDSPHAGFAGPPESPSAHVAETAAGARRSESASANPAAGVPTRCGCSRTTSGNESSGEAGRCCGSPRQRRDQKCPASGKQQ